VLALVATPAPPAVATADMPEPKAKAKRPRVGRAASRSVRLESRRVGQAMREFFRTNPSAADRNELFKLLRALHRRRPGSPERQVALARLD
jgi:hypothetical protein